jgi:hypothetical protein
MKNLVKGFVFLSALLLAVGAFAAERSLTIYSPMSVNGAKLAPGDYKVHYDLKGSNAEVKFMQGKKEVASATGQVVEKERAQRDGIVTQKDGDGSTRLVELQFANQKSSIRFVPESSGGN